VRGTKKWGYAEDFPDNISRAIDWLNKKSKDQFSPVVAKRRGYAEFVAWIYYIHREDKPDIRFVLDNWNGIIRRICVR
jgi:hypothetical protein